MSDKYDKAIEILSDDPEQINKAWDYYLSHPAGCLFDLVPGIGVCLTQIRGGLGKTDHPLAIRVMNDVRIPANEKDITPTMLPVFAEYQREFDLLREAEKLVKNDEQI